MKEPIWVRSFDDLPVMMDAVLVAKLFGCNEQYVRQRANRGEIPSYRIGRFLRFKKSDILEYIEENKLKTKLTR